ncbi:hypothetical protein CC1G_08775 [Coprinopsis cinerea okayama7|uniref:Uncharacterized protein n=1 Tax=Coprinopsis cinerea (strain Okayama-7 / 130 / ATCC MYA-4618 / FGSC 9003) TaxID=240176 RepID=A8N425_COPC7|nr:hypothetical protein CC1G_08775 [Coprinopsis cinerea okayama7\|eukprot:XP_001829620.2 hypothetical protein CC1G_08775 [Coprinopsis cinerea okayama7\
MSERNTPTTTKMATERLEIEDEEDRQRRLQSVFERLNTFNPNSAQKDVSGLPKFDFGDRTTFEIKPNTELLSRIQSFLPQLQASNEALLKRAEMDPASVDIEHITEGTDKVIQMDLGLGLFEQRNAKRPFDHDEDTTMSDSSSSSSSLHSASSNSSSSSASSSSSSSSDSTSDSNMEDDDYSDEAEHAKFRERYNQMLLAREQEQEADWDSDASSEIITCFVPDRPVRPLPKRFLKKSCSPSQSNSATPTPSAPRPSIVVLDEQENDSGEK